MAESLTQEELEVVYDKKQAQLRVWFGKIRECDTLICNLRVKKDQIDEWHDLDTETRKIRYTAKEFEVLHEAGQIWIRRLGYRSEYDRVQNSMPNFEGWDMVTKKSRYSPYIPK